MGKKEAWLLDDEKEVRTMIWKGKHLMGQKIAGEYDLFFCADRIIQYLNDEKL